MSVSIPENKLLTVVLNGTETAYDPAASYAPGACVFTDKLPIQHSCELAEDKVTDYRTALYVTKDGISAPHSAAAAIAADPLPQRRPG